MTNWRMRLGEWMSGNGSAREGRTGGRSGGKAPAKAAGLAGSGELPGTVLPLSWALAMGLVLLALHLVLFLPVTSQKIDEFPESVRRPEARLGLARALEGAGRYEEAVGVYADLASDTSHIFYRIAQTKARSLPGGG